MAAMKAFILVLLLGLAMVVSASQGPGGRGPPGGSGPPGLGFPPPPRGPPFRPPCRNETGGSSNTTGTANSTESSSG
ncbi:hypothetical protein V5799_006582 [Amblyomma americanum]|uniref:Secreted protein n=1 Tax=Amblyomma americanum TaxID=6943 RepID=A0AAQ4DVZ6_AMBAM